MTIKILYLIIPGLIAIIGNIIFYAIVKNRIDKSIEKYKISFAGVYQEKIKIHKELLERLFEIKSKVQQYQYSGNQEIGEELFLDFNKFISCYTKNQPFLKQEILDGLKTITNELQSCFDDFYMHNSLSQDTGLEPSIRTETLKKFFESGNKFKKNQPFKQIEELLIKEMRKDLKIDE
jgi:hypothetical protein